MKMKAHFTKICRMQQTVLRGQLMAAMCIVDKNKDLESIIQVPILGNYVEKVKIKTSKRKKTIRIISGTSEIEIESQQRKSAIENKGFLETSIKKK
jgi:hypothetical protein